MAVTIVPSRIAKQGHIAVLRRARKCHRCEVCPEDISQGEQHYSITAGGGGLGWLKFPDRAHLRCIDKYFEQHTVPSQEKEGKEAKANADIFRQTACR